MSGVSTRRAAVVAALAVTGALGSLGTAAAETEPVPAATLIAAQANPAVQLIQTTYSGQVTVPTAVSKKTFDDLLDEAQKQARKGRIPSDNLSIAKWAFGKLAADPGKYLKAGGPERTEDVTFSGTCTGWWITPDGHMVTAGHCVQNTPAQIEAGFAEYGLADLTKKDVETALKDLMGSVEPDKELTDLVTKVFVTFNTDNLEVSGTKVKYEVVLPLPGGGMNASSTHLPIDLVAADGTGGTGKDVALLKLAGARNLPTVPLGTDGDVRVGNALYAVGFPGTVNRDEGLTEKSRLYPAITEGAYSALRETTSGVPYIQAQTPIYGGNSGGPVFNAEGKVVALVSATYLNETQTERQENQSLFFPIGQINEFLAAQGVTPQESPATRTYNAALNDFFADRYSLAVAGFKETLGLYPLHPYAAGYIKESQEAIAAGRDSSSGAPSSSPQPDANAVPDAGATAPPAASAAPDASATPAPGTAAANADASPAPVPSIETEPVAAEEGLMNKPMALVGIFGSALLVLFALGGLLMALHRRKLATATPSGPALQPSTAGSAPAALPAPFPFGPGAFAQAAPDGVTPQTAPPAAPYAPAPGTPDPAATRVYPRNPATPYANAPVPPPPNGHPGNRPGQV
ncbi:S1 family peptidase [Planobispora rosea]|uniref:S1 family peptidase n=1 Tax=Planobispora rosea TaxID=35762 RepID=UPI0016707335|nr:serine protease [Planobispora rosea]